MLHINFTFVSSEVSTQDDESAEDYKHHHCDYSADHCVVNLWCRPLAGSRV